MNEPSFERSGFLEVPPGYSSTETRIEYHYVFPSREILEAKEQPDGTVQIVIKSGENVFFDFIQLLPGGYKFVSYPYVAHLEKETGEDVPWVGWLAVPKWKHIQIGDFESPKDILGLLHEVGHITNYELEERGVKKERVEHERFRLKDEEVEYAGDTELFTLHQEEIAKVISRTERDAWAYAARILRKLNRELKIDLKDLFPDQKSVKKVIDEDLATYRKNFEWLVENDPTFGDDLQKMFDREITRP